MIVEEMLATRRDEIAASPDLSALYARLVERAAPVLERMPVIPTVKALLSRDGGVCPDDGTPLRFDPWSPDQHVCPRCGRAFGGERHHAHWARAQHLWVAERAMHLATLHAIDGSDATAARARELLAAYHTRYFELPNRDNVLGPTHLFFSTYLESIWILHYIGAAHLLRTVGALDDSEIEAVNAIAEESAALIGEFNEGMSNRQTWHAAALTALGVWFEDDDLLSMAIEGRTGLMGHLADGFGADGMWFEGENYHLFALRGLLIGLSWARAAGADLLADPEVAEHLAMALMAPATTALPDLTFPARKDARFGVSLAHPAYLECWEAGQAWVGGTAHPEIAEWLRALYARPAQTEGTYDSYLVEAGETVPPFRTRHDLSAWALWTMAPSLPESVSAWRPASRLLENQGLAILRQAEGNVLASLECGGGGGGHGHPDRLHLTVFAHGVHWLPDPGAGSYVSRDLFWYRSTLAHNAPRLDGADQQAADTSSTAFDAGTVWQWAAGRWGDVQRGILLGPDWLVDVVELAGRDPHQLELPWHLNASVTVETPGTWAPGELAGEFISDVEAFTPAAAGAIALRAVAGDASIRLWLVGDMTLLRAQAPGLPGANASATFFVARLSSPASRLTTVVDLAGTVTAATMAGSLLTITTAAEATTVQINGADAVVTQKGRIVTLAGRRGGLRSMPSILKDPPMLAAAEAPWVDAPPALDGTLAGFDRSAPLHLDDEVQYFRSEEPYAGPEAFATRAWVNWDQHGIYVAVEVTKDEVILRADDAQPLLLDNDPDDIHADGVQVCLQLADHAPISYLLRPGPDTDLRIRSIDASMQSPPAHGAWQRTRTGYRITAQIPCAGLDVVQASQPLRFDLLINEMQPGRVRRAGQLIWSGGPGWVYLRGDRFDPARFGELQLIG
ncbi:MAG TPA: heparinase II/III family protein [Gemmatimonadales bacterium]|nr:heparinase II/III family protein [Gemmatimonadales bacterium]